MHRRNDPFRSPDLRHLSMVSFTAVSVDDCCRLSWPPRQRCSSVDRRSDHITDAVECCQFYEHPSSGERNKFKLAVIVCRALHGTAPRYLSYQLCYVADLPTRKSTSVVSFQTSRRPPFTTRHCRWPLIFLLLDRGCGSSNLKTSEVIT